MASPRQHSFGHAGAYRQTDRWQEERELHQSPLDVRTEKIFFLAYKSVLVPTAKNNKRSWIFNMSVARS